MVPERINYLIELFFSQTLDESQLNELNTWISLATDDELKELLQHGWMQHKPTINMPADASDRILQRLFQNETSTTNIDKVSAGNYSGKVRIWTRMVAAAAIVGVVLFSAYFWFAEYKASNVTKIASVKETRSLQKAGSKKALLTLSNGSQIILDNISGGKVAHDGNSTIVKLSDGQIAYNKDSGASAGNHTNIVTTPPGGQYQLFLSDGSKVWLNASSEIKFPTTFSGTDRTVQITGEAYFEIATIFSKDKHTKIPFIVQINSTPGGRIEVLGTSFNVNAYKDEPFVKTTLLNGSVKFSNSYNNRILLPGEQLQQGQSGSLKLLANANMEEAIAWKNGFFQFERADLASVMRNAARWYDLEVVFEGPLSKDRFTGKMERSVDLSTFLKWMQWSDVKFSLQGRKLIVKN